MSDTSIQPDYAALATAPVCADPFPHVVVPHFIRQDDLPRLFASLPDIRSGGSFPPSAPKISPLMQPVVAATEGPEWRRSIAEK